jgi:membrane associated rhomboid family serine protease
MIWLLPWETDENARHHPWATWTLMALCIGAFLVRPDLDAAGMHAWYLEYGLVPGDWHAYQFITSSFMHGGWLHLLGNMLFLWMFGDNVEDALGIGGFLLVYFLGGLAGDLLFVSANAHMIPSIGASGSIAAIAGAYAVMFFDRRVSVKVILVVLPIYTLELAAVWVLLLWFGMDVLLTISGGGTLGEGGTNYVAHGAGFLFGAAVGAAAVAYGTMRRYTDIPNGDPWLGYLPKRVAEAHRMEVLKRVRQQQILESHRQAARVEAK